MTLTNRKRIFIILFLIIQLCLVWPIYPLFSGIYPMVLGLPLSFAWVILVLVSAFGLLVWYYKTDSDRVSTPNIQSD